MRRITSPASAPTFEHRISLFWIPIISITKYVRAKFYVVFKAVAFIRSCIQTRYVAQHLVWHWEQFKWGDVPNRYGSSWKSRPQYMSHHTLHNAPSK